MAVIRQRYSADKINKLQQFLIGHKERGNPIEFKITVDGQEAVSRTDDPELFQTHEDLIDEDTKRIEVFVFNGHSKRCNRHLFTLTEESDESKPLHGIEVQEQINDALTRERQKWEFERLIAENKDLQGELAELSEENEGLIEELNELKESQSPLTAAIGGVGAKLVEGILSSPKVGQILSGIGINTDKELPAKSREEQESEVNYHLAQNGQPDNSEALSENDLV